VITTDTPMIGAPAMMIGVAEKGYATLRVTATAEGGHSSAPPREIGSVNLAKAVLAIHADQFPVELRGPGASMLEVLAAKAGGASKLAIANRWLFAPQIKAQIGKSPAAEAMFHTTIAPTMLTGSPKENVLPQSASALINYRIAPWDSSAKVIERARAAAKGLPVTVEWTERPPREPSPVSSTTSQGWKLIVASAHADRPGMVFSPYLVVAGTDSRNMAAVSDDVYRFMPVELDSQSIKLFHGTDEHISIENLESQIRFFARLIATAAG
jgi:carboxypeptidase PM20D1